MPRWLWQENEENDKELTSPPFHKEDPLDPCMLQSSQIHQFLPLLCNIKRKKKYMMWIKKH